MLCIKTVIQNYVQLKLTHIEIKLEYSYTQLPRWMTNINTLADNDCSTRDEHTNDLRMIFTAGLTSPPWHCHYFLVTESGVWLHVKELQEVQTLYVEHWNQHYLSTPSSFPLLLFLKFKHHIILFFHTKVGNESNISSFEIFILLILPWNCLPVASQTKSTAFQSTVATLYFHCLKGNHGVKYSCASCGRQSMLTLLSLSQGEYTPENITKRSRQNISNASWKPSPTFSQSPT